MQQMTRKEYKAFMTKWRAVLGNVNTPDDAWKHEAAVQDDAFNTAFQAVYKLIPVYFWECRQITSHKRFRKPSDRLDMQMNSEGFCPNSYPHATRNP
jgi:hypothetical protein